MSKLTIAIFLFFGLLKAKTIYSTSFEAPAFSVGPLGGQNGWVAVSTDASSVVNTFSFDGTQAVEYNSSLTGQLINALPFSYDSLSDPNQIVTISDEVYTTGTTREAWEAMVVYSNAGFLAQFEIDSGILIFGDASTLISITPISDHSWDNLTMTFNFANHTESAYLNGALIGLAPLDPSVTGLGAVGFGYGIKQNAASDIAYFDSVSVTATGAATTPEPASLALIGCGLLGLWRLARRRA